LEPEIQRIIEKNKSEVKKLTEKHNKELESLED
jgi:hypothetical protein